MIIRVRMRSAAGEPRTISVFEPLDGGRAVRRASQYGIPPPARRVGPNHLFRGPGFVLDLAGIRRKCGTNQRARNRRFGPTLRAGCPEFPELLNTEPPQPLSRELGTKKTVKARCWPCLEPFSVHNSLKRFRLLSVCSIADPHYS